MNTGQPILRETVRKELKLLLIDLNLLPFSFNVNENEDYLNDYIKNVDLFNAIKNVFPELDPISSAFILNKVNNKDFDLVEYINLFHICDSVLEHYRYFMPFKERLPRRYYTNTFFENFLSNKERDSFYYLEYEMPLENYNEDFIKNNKRRLIDIDNNEHFSYTAYLCGSVRNNKQCSFGEECPLAHTLNEIKYHPLFYKKLKCREKEHNKIEHCPYYHSIEERDTNVNLNDIRVIDIITELKQVIKPDEYNSFRKEEEDNKKKTPLILNDILPTEFNVETYKMCRCPLGELCKLEEKLCLNYHSEQDRRRHPCLYSDEPCRKLLTKKQFDPKKKCPDGDKCGYSHNQYEYMYHPNQFRKKSCPMEYEEGECCYRISCPFKHEDDKENLKWEGVDFSQSNIHEENIDKNAVIVCNADIIREYYLDMIEDYKNKQDGKIKELHSIIDKHMCQLCNKNCMLQEKEYSVHTEGNRVSGIMCISCRQQKENEINQKQNEQIKKYIIGKSNN